MDEQQSGSSNTNIVGATQENGNLCENDVEPKSESEDKDNAAVLCSGDVGNFSETDNPVQSLDEFKNQLSLKRQSVLSELKAKITCLRQQLADEREINEQLRTEQRNHKCCGTNTVAVEPMISQESSDTIVTTNDDVANMVDANDHVARTDIALKAELADVQLSLQLANAEILSLTSELRATQRQVASLKEVIVFSKQMVDIRENQLNQLKQKLKEIEDSLAERELKIMSDQLRIEYDRQLTNIRNLRALYEERARVSAAERENLIRQLETKRTELEAEVEKSASLEVRLAALEKDLDQSSENLSAVQEQFFDCKSENKSIHAEMAVINQLFSQLIMGFNGGNDIDIDKLTHMLEDNRDLLSDITKRETSSNGSAALPKLLFDLVSQSEGSEEHEVDANAEAASAVDIEETPLTTDIPAAQNIVDNLPKVWKVLIELLNHQKAEKVCFNETGESEDCYNSVETPTGPQLVLSVSKTYIKLKDLILEKKFLQKETNKLKNLNSHLESRLGQQEKRLGAVSIELNKTWSLVGRMQRQHRQLHTHEQVLRYQLQQKRRMLNELKDELEYCRRKWALAREKNNESQNQWNTLRLEFSNRKLIDANTSAESGYSDDPVSDDEATTLDCADKKKTVDISEFNEHEPCSSSPRDCTEPSLPLTVQTAITDVFQTTSTINEDLGLQNIATNQVDCNGLAYASSSSVVASVVAEPTRVNKIKKKKALPSTSRSTSGTLPKLSRELRLSDTVKEKSIETLEQMFYRISGLEQPVPENNANDSDESEEESEDETNEGQIVGIESEYEKISVISTDTVSVEPSRLSKATEAYEKYIAGPSLPKPPSKLELEDEERRINRAARFKRLEDQCQQLINQVTKTSHRGDELNLQLDQVQKRYTPNRVIEEQPEQVASTANTTAKEVEVENTSTSTDCSAALTVKEQEYTSRRAARLKRLEEECQAFLNKVNTTNSRANQMNDKLTDLHERYGSGSSEMNTNAEPVDHTDVNVKLQPLKQLDDPQVIKSPPNLNESNLDGHMSTLDAAQNSLIETMNVSNMRASMVDEIDLNGSDSLTHIESDCVTEGENNNNADNIENERQQEDLIDSEEESIRRDADAEERTD